MNRQYIFIISGRADQRSLKALETALASVPAEVRTHFEFRYTEYPGHAGDIAREISEKYGGRVTVVSCGGDGTINEVCNSLAFTNTPLICLPFGTGNDLSKTIYGKKTPNLRKSLENLDSYKPRKIDLIRVDSYDVMGNHLPMWSRYCVNVTSVGLDTRVQAAAKAMVRAKPKSRYVRKTAYVRSALRSIKRDRASNFTYKLELESGEMYEGTNTTNTLISICNGKFYGDGFCPAPGAKLDDGIIDVCAVDDVSFGRAVRLIAKYRFGKHEGNQGIHSFKTTSGIITSTDPSYQLQGNYDGEDFYGNRIRFEVCPDAMIMGFPEGVDE
ncbi:Diacylglycerol kinase family enzyme [Ruminococcaceae bacterium YRB3002]|nr:Diacylglycerol kinase family enzyme [Ruminococcaceae bacterium YRB3002]